jgi:hypothetical protein
LTLSTILLATSLFLGVSIHHRAATGGSCKLAHRLMICGTAGTQAAIAMHRFYLCQLHDRRVPACIKCVVTVTDSLSPIHSYIDRRSSLLMCPCCSVSNRSLITDHGRKDLTTSFGAQ